MIGLKMMFAAIAVSALAATALAQSPEADTPTRTPSLTRTPTTTRTFTRTYTPTATPNPSCGNGTIQVAEQCDDGDTDSGDGCDSVCRVEPCWTCSGVPSMCSPAPSAITTIDNTGDVGRHTSIAIAADALAVISYYDVSNGDLKVARCHDSLCSSASTQTVDSGGNVGSATSIAIGSDGLPIISYWGDDELCRPFGFGQICAEGVLKVAHCQDPACALPATISVHQFYSTRNDSTSILIGGDGLPVILYSTGGPSPFGAAYTTQVLHCADLACTSFNTNTVIDSLEGLQGGTGTSVSSVSGSDGRPLLVYGSGLSSGQRLARCNDVACSSVTARYIDPSQSGPGNSIAIGPDGFALTSRQEPAAGTLRIVRCTNLACSSWAGSTIEDSGSVGAYTSIAVGGDGLGVVAYYDEDVEDLNVAHCHDEGCSTATTSRVDGDDAVGEYLDLAISADGAPLISYYDSTNGDLKVAHVCPITVGCGNGTLDAGEVCDDGNSVGGDACPSSCNEPPATHTPTTTATPSDTPTPEATATPTETPTETATPLPSTTPSATSTPLPADTATPTPSPTEAPLCQPVPSDGCSDGTAAALLLSSAGDAERRRMTWKWSGSSPAAPEVGDYAVCVYDSSADAAVLVLAEAIAGSGMCGRKECWSSSTSGVRYRSRSGTGSLELKISRNSRGSKIKLSAKGDRLPLDEAVSETLRFAQEPQVTVQVVKRDGSVCWQSVLLSPAIRNTADRFKDGIR
ncbi:MAG TPA: DUF4215 domain-containing protein [Terriglobales bacterium]|nr:DUF4215 domain-containing protein [Terriglobales bacterium]